MPATGQGQQTTLRAWQAAALERLEGWSARAGEPFLLSAAPGAGKTRPALVLARRLLGEGAIALGRIAQRDGLVARQRHEDLLGALDHQLVARSGSLADQDHALARRGARLVVEIEGALGEKHGHRDGADQDQAHQARTHRGQQPAQRRARPNLGGPVFGA